MRAHERRQLRELAQFDSLQTLGKHEQALVGHLDDFVHHGRGSHRVKVAGLRGVDPRLALGHHDDGLVFPQRIDQLNRTFPAHGQGQNSVREQHRIPYRKHRKSLLFVLISLFLGVRSTGGCWLICLLECNSLKFR